MTDPAPRQIRTRTGRQQRRELSLRQRTPVSQYSPTRVVIGFLVAWVMTALPLSVLLLKFPLYQLHKNIGLIVAGLAVLRLILAFRAGDIVYAACKAACMPFC
jgi:hypothetical protein